MTDVNASIDIVQVNVEVSQQVVAESRVVQEQEIVSRTEVIEITTGTGDVQVSAAIEPIAFNVNLLAVGPPTVSEDEVALARRTNIEDDGNTIYIGEANPGVQDNQALWRIKRIVFTPPDDDGETRWASGNSNLDKVWNDHLILTYL